ncbi:MAG: endonuclease/exonuclease/phosphatase family protein [Gemmatimonadetes bacterium]|nr:endonuclease/exonuclease/phosphatase family protein [Gemmatimonadota bacterium]
MGSHKLTSWLQGSASVNLVLQCATKQHRVRLDPRRFWTSARCPVCKSAVDPTRVRRMAAWVVQRYLSSGQSPAIRLTVWLSWGYALAAILAWLVLWRLGDRWWPATVALFGPRWILLLPLAVLIPAAALYRRRLLGPLLVGFVIMLGPVMGFRIGWSSWIGKPDGPPDLRVMTFNVAGTAPSTLQMLIEWNPDIIAFQECGAQLAKAISRLQDWFHDSQHGLCLVSRFPIRRVDPMERQNLAYAGGSGLVVRYAIETPQRLVEFTNLHLETPRAGLAPLRQGQIERGLRNLQSKYIMRDIESRQARRWVNEAQGPVLVAGDFNMPVESVIYQRYWSDLGNAFSQAGVGFGATRLNGWIRVRIDHILMGKGWRATRAFVGPELESDHRPMIADLRWVGLH